MIGGPIAFPRFFRRPRRPRFGVAFLFAFICIAMLSVSCSRTKVRKYSRTELMFGTVCRISLVDTSGELDGDAALEETFSRLADIEKRISRTQAGSEISSVNGQAGTAPVAVSEETYELVKTALQYARLTDGAFNPAIGPLVSLWGINTETAKVPSDEEISRVLPLLDWREVVLDDVERSIFLPRQGMSLDLGGIGKGYAADVAKATLRQFGASSALVNLGGNILVIGTKPDGEAWRIGLQDPDSSRGEFFLSVSLTDGTVVTSGPYERYFVQDGVRYHHILDASTGYPAVTHIASVTIVGADSTGADALSTAAFVLGVEPSLALLRTLPGVEAVFLMDDGTIRMSEGLADDASRWRLATDRYSVKLGD
jgi:thiamine biosynthesis lipoprotein